MNDLYDNVRRNSVETYNRARDVVNPVVLFNEDPCYLVLSWCRWSNELSAI